MDKQTFDTRKQAQAEIAKMVGWDAKPVQIEVTDGNDIVVKYVIEIKDGNTIKYMREDGYVR